MHRSGSNRCLLTAAAAVLVLVALLGSCSSDPDSRAAGSTTTASTITASTTTAEVATDVLADLVDPPGADGRTLTLARYTIAPGAKLVPHVHPGVQMASIDSGTLTYTVVSGTASIRRAGGSGTTDVTGPTTIELVPGDAVVELGEMVHFGENLTDEPIVIVAALLTVDGSDLAVPVTTTTPAP